MEFWQNKRVIVTGGDGFLGRHLVRNLRDRGCNDIIVPLRKEFDLRKGSDVTRLLEMQADMIIHLAAAVGGIGANRLHPGQFFYDNAVMGITLMEQARCFGIKKFVCLGTICAYPKITPLPFTEENLWNGYPEETNAPYGLAKKMLLVQAQAYRQEYGFNCIYLLPVNLYGPGDNFDPRSSHVIPALIRKCFDAKLQGAKEIICWGTGTASREFLYVGDAADGIALAAEHYNGPEPVNLGAGFEITIRDLAEIIREMTGFKGELKWDPNYPDGQPRRLLDTSRAERLFGFKSKMSFREGISTTIEWYRNTYTIDSAKSCAG